MALPTPKELAKLAQACRKVGIKTFKSGDIEFTLTDEAPRKRTVSQKAPMQALDTANEFDSDGLTEEQLLMWSTGTSDGAQDQQ